MFATNRVLQKERERAERLIKRYRAQGGKEILISKNEHNQLTGGIPPKLIHEIIRHAEHPSLPHARESRQIELRKPFASQKKTPASSARHPVSKETQKRVRARLESLYKEFKAAKGTDRAAIQRVFKPLADYARTLQSEEAHTQFDAKLKDVVKLLNADKPHEAARLISSLSSTIHLRMRARGERAATPSREPAPPTRAPAPTTPPKERDTKKISRAEAEAIKVEKPKPEKRRTGKNDPLQGEPTMENINGALRTSHEITSMLHGLNVATRLREAGNTAARTQLSEVVAKSLIIYNPQTQQRLLGLAQQLKREMEAENNDAASQTLSEMAEIASKIKFKTQSFE